MSEALPTERERGMILINVLLFVAIASSVLLLMITAEEGALHRTSGLVEASRARAAALGGELSAIVALRRDGVTAPEADFAAEPWGKLNERDVAIRGGRFTLAVTDAQDRFNINLLMRQDPAAIMLAARIGGTVGLSRRQLAEAVGYIRVAGPLTDLGPLGITGLKPDAQARLLRLVTALPGDTKINLNSVSEELLGIMIEDPIAAQALVRLRERQGFLTPQDFLLQGIAIPPLSAFASGEFWVRTRVTIGDTSQQLTTLLVRRGETGGMVVRPIGRWWGASQPSQAPALP